MLAAKSPISIKFKLPDQICTATKFNGKTTIMTRAPPGVLMMETWQLFYQTVKMTIISMFNHENGQKSVTIDC